MRKPQRLGVWIAIGLVAGIVAGQVMFHIYGGAPPKAWGAIIGFLGQSLFLGLLRMIMIPLSGLAVFAAVGALAQRRELGRLGGLTLVYFLGIMTAGSIVGATAAAITRPGAKVGAVMRGQAVVGEVQAGQAKASEAEAVGLGGAVKRLVADLIPANPIAAAADGRILSVIVFSMLLAAAVAAIGERGRSVFAVADGLFAAFLHLVGWIMCLAPIGIFALVAGAVANVGIFVLAGPLGFYVAVTAGAMLVQALLVLPAVLWVFGRANPYAYLWAMREALLTAFTTASSAATIPVTLAAAQQRGGASKRASEFVIPLGVTGILNGTALWEAATVIFLFQASGVHLGLPAIATIIFAAVLAAIAASGVPAAGIVTMVIVIEAVNGLLPHEQALPLASIGLILGVDRLLDMCRTTLNVWGHAVGAKLLSRFAPDDAGAVLVQHGEHGGHGEEKIERREEAGKITPSASDPDESPALSHRRA